VPADENIRVLSTREGYDLWAAVYDQDGNPLIALDAREVPRVLGDVRGLRIADIGCGTGRHALWLAAAGANVTALDFSTAMLAQARAKPGASCITFVRHDVAASLPFRDAAFDRVLCSLVIDHIADLDGLFRELKRICTPQGCVVISVMHPAMMLRGIQARFTDPATGLETRPRSCPNQIADYVMALTRAGLRFDHMSEHCVDDAVAAAFPRGRKYLGWPMLVVMRLSPRRDIP